MVEDLVSRKWIADIVSAEETSTQIEIVFTDALAAEGLLAGVEARADGLVDPKVDDEARPILLAVSDNGPQMSSGRMPPARRSSGHWAPGGTWAPTWRPPVWCGPTPPHRNQSRNADGGGAGGQALGKALAGQAVAVAVEAVRVPARAALGLEEGLGLSVGGEIRAVPVPSASAARSGRRRL